MKLDTFKIERPLELLTPCFCGGADPSAKGEIRIPSLRGQLRFWLRLLFPQRHLDDRLMGSAHGTHPSSSLVSLSLKHVENANDSPVDLAGYTGTRSPQEAMQNDESYFLWPLRTQSRGAIRPAQNGTVSFTLTLAWLPHAQVSPQDKRDLITALDAFCLLGTFGTRASRGYGGIWPKSKNFADGKALTADLADLPSDITVRLLPGTHSSGRAALAAAAKWMKALRLGSRRLYDGAVSKWGEADHDTAINRTRDAKVYRQALGLPLAQNFFQGPKFQSTFNGKKDRYPSPVRIKVARINGQYCVLVVLLQSQLLPEGEVIMVGSTATKLSHDLINHIAGQGTSIH